MAKTAAVVTLSDKGSKGEREDLSGKFIVNHLKENGFEVVDYILLPDEFEEIKKALIDLSDNKKVNLIITTGGTGFSKRDVTPEATMAASERNASGIAEAIRYNSLQITGRAMLSRGASVIRKDTVIVNLPGSLKAVKENLEYILPHIVHGIEILTNTTNECGGQ